MSLRPKAIIRGGPLAAITGLAIGLSGISQQSAREASAGFNSPSFSGAVGVSNGITEPGDTLALDEQVYEENQETKGISFKRALYKSERKFCQ